jgi:hypothetical protein
MNSFLVLWMLNEDFPAPPAASVFRVSSSGTDGVARVNGAGGVATINGVV